MLLTDDSLLSEIDDIADESLWSSRIAADGDTAATNTNDAIEWLDRVLRCALLGKVAHGPDTTYPGRHRPS